MPLTITRIINMGVIIIIIVIIIKIVEGDNLKNTENIGYQITMILFLFSWIRFNN